MFFLVGEHFSKLDSSLSLVCVKLENYAVPSSVPGNSIGLSFCGHSLVFEMFLVLVEVSLEPDCCRVLCRRSPCSCCCGYWQSQRRQYLRLFSSTSWASTTGWVLFSTPYGSSNWRFTQLFLRLQIHFHESKWFLYGFFVQYLTACIVWTRILFNIIRFTFQRFILKIMKRRMILIFIICRILRYGPHKITRLDHISVQTTVLNKSKI